MGLWDSIKSAYTSIDKSIGGILPGGYVKPKSSTSTSSGDTSGTSGTSGSTSTSTSTSSSGSSGGGGGGSSSGTTSSGSSYTTQELPAQQQDAVIVTDFNTGESVETRIGSSGRITSQTVSVIDGDEERAQRLISSSTRSGGLVTGTQQEKQLSYREQRDFTLDTSRGEDTGLIVGGDKVTQEFGAPVITSQEAEMYGIDPNRTPVYVLSQGTPDEMAREFSYASSLPYTSRGIQTKDLVISNLANLRTGKEVYSLSQQGVTDINVGTIYSENVVEIRSEYGDRPLGERAKLYGAGFAQGITAIGVKTVEFGGSIVTNLGVRTGDAQTIRQSYDFEFGGNIGRSANYPVARSAGFLESPGTYLSESVSSPSIVAQTSVITAGLASFGRRVVGLTRSRGSLRAGATEATLEAGSIFSPVRIRSGIYGSSITEQTAFNIKSVKFTQQGVTNRIYTGRSPSGISIAGEESITQAGKGGGLVVTSAPITEVRAGGAILRAGTRTTIQPYELQASLAQGRGYGARSNEYFTQQITGDLPAGTARVTTSRGVSIYETPETITIYEDLSRGIVTRSGGVTSGQDQIVSDFISGRARSIYRIDRFGEVRANVDTGVISQDFIYSPSGRYRVTPQFRGREIDLNRLVGRGTDQGFTSFQGRGSGQTLQFGETPTAPQINTQRLTQFSRSTPIIARPQESTPTPRPNIVNQATERVLTSSQIITPAVFSSTSQSIRSRARTTITPVMAGALSIPQFSQSINQVPGIRAGQGTRISTVTVPRQDLNFQFVPPGITGFTNVPPTQVPGFSTIIAPPISLSGFGGDVGASIIQGGQRVTEYTPSFSALAFNLQGTYKGGKLARSGLDFRPIIPDFQFNTGLNSRKLRLRI